MLIAWSSHSGTAGKADGPRALSNYMDAETVIKRLSDGRRAPVRRRPAPEILFGDAAQLRMAIGSSACVHRYASCVMSFAASDIDVDAFNAGEPNARFKADLALKLLLEMALAGIPHQARPPVYATTHTHTGALEINVAIPRWIMGPDGKQRGFNPAPPEKAHATWDAVRDLLNHRFDWADPECPDRRRELVLPNWMLKVAAETRRAGGPLKEGPREQITQEVFEQTSAGVITDRSSLLNWLQARLEDTGLILHGMTSTSVTIGSADAAPSARFKLRGAIFEESLGQGAPTPGQETIEKARAGRQRRLRTAPDRVQRLWNRRAAFNRSRYGLNRWPPKTFAARHYETVKPGDEPLIIPIKHHLNGLTGDSRHDFEIDTDGTRFARYGGADELGGFGARQSVGREDRGFDAAASTARRVCDDFKQLVETLPAKGLIAAISTRVSQLVRTIRSRMLLKRISAAIPDSLLNTLAHTQEALEVYNGTSAHALRPNEANRIAAETVGGADLPAARAFGGQLRRNHGPSEERGRRAGSNRQCVGAYGKHDERGAARGSAGIGTQIGDPQPTAGSADAVVERSARMVGRPAAPNSRAGLLNYLRTEVQKRECSAEVRLQFFEGSYCWPPRLELCIAKVGNRPTPSATGRRPTCRLLCVPSLVPQIVPVLKQALEGGWVRGVDFDAEALNDMPEDMLPLLRSLEMSGPQPTSSDLEDNTEGEGDFASAIDGGPTG
ncbi:hypothetical protein [Sulfitobacter sp. HI0054]|uniref:hypothetical protein n=2 Tax=Sulfitobacter sp. HI0054 TaxID=1822238 RepID=UPI000B2CFDB3|nr:hypothetical protein [Sulfitobacter sp. HI0054]